MIRFRVNTEVHLFFVLPPSVQGCFRVRDKSVQPSGGKTAHASDEVKRVTATPGGPAEDQRD